jgi:hypothetical protein
MTLIQKQYFALRCVQHLNQKQYFECFQDILDCAMIGKIHLPFLVDSLTIDYLAIMP